MSDTTIRLDAAVRDKLKVLADEDHVTLGDLLARLAERGAYARDGGRGTPPLAAGAVVIARSSLAGGAAYRRKHEGAGDAQARPAARGGT